MDDAASAPTARAKAPVPAHVTKDRIYEVDMYALDGIEEGYHEAWKRMQTPDTPELIWTPYTGGHWIATRGKLIQEIFADPARFSSEVIFLPKEAGQKYEMVPTRMDPPEHTPYRKLLAKGLNAGQVRRIEEKARRVSIDLIESFRQKGGCDFSRDYAQIFPVQVFMALADLPMEDVPLLNRLACQMTRPDGNSPEEMAKSLDDANRGFFAYAEPIIKQRVGQEGDDLITIMVNGDIDGQPINHEKALGLVSLLLLGGLDTVVNFLGYMMLYLARRPDKALELRSQPQKIARGMEEIFRRFPVVSDARMVTGDFEYCGAQLRKGDMILLPTALHGLDETLTPNPMELDFERPAVTHALFGGGPHRCAGAHLARMEVLVTLEEWLRRIPEFSLEPGARPIYHSGIVATVENVPFIWPLV